ncbi:MAG: DUF366 family protein [Candidatus Aureabacteria bacterium]|nr:DUF366 family protein [Candidatus Auribacterota bacterium]
MTMTIHWVDLHDDLTYDGSQLSHEWVLRHTGSDHAIVTFEGPCCVDKRFMVDFEDLKNGCRIQSDRMLHFVIKHKGFPLPFIVLAQRLFMTMIKELLEDFANLSVARRGDDLFIKEGKLSISVATAAENNSVGLIHAALNTTREGTPPEVRTASLSDLPVDVNIFKKRLVEMYTHEFNDIFHAAGKVRHV